MKSKIALFALSFLAFSIVFGQEKINLRGDFLKSRVQPPKQSAPASGNPAAKAKPQKPKPHTKEAPQTTSPPSPPQAIGLGYTVFLKTGDNRWQRVNPKRAFVSGEQLRFLLETNTDGYLYIFHQANSERPALFFPDARVQNGNNYIRANTPLLVPEGFAITFDNTPATETFIFVVSRTPIVGIPPGSALKQTIAANLPPNVLQQLANASAPMEDTIADAGETMTASEASRGVKLTPSDPAPTTIFLNRNERETRVTVRLKLVHN